MFVYGAIVYCLLLTGVFAESGKAKEADSSDLDPTPTVTFRPRKSRKTVRSHWSSRREKAHFRDTSPNGYWTNQNFAQTYASYGGTPPWNYGNQETNPQGGQTGQPPSSGTYPQPGYPQGAFQPQYPQQPYPGYPQTGSTQTGYPQQPYPGSQPSYPQAPQPGAPQPGYPQPTQPSYPQQPQPGHPQRPQPGFPQPGQTGYPQGSGSQPQYPQGPGSQPQYPQGSGSQPQYPQGPGFPAQYPQGPGSQPQYPQGPGSQPQYPQGPGSQPQYPQGPGSQPGFPQRPEYPSNTGGSHNGPPGSEPPRPNRPPPEQVLPGSPFYPQIQPGLTGTPDEELKQYCKASRGQFGLPHSCRKYVNCWDDVVVEQECAGGLVFNEDKKYCDFSDNVNCGDRPMTQEPTSPNGAESNCSSPFATYRSTSNCGEFFVCAHGVPYRFVCPGGLAYNDELGVCDYVQRVECNGVPVLPPEETTEDNNYTAEYGNSEYENGQSNNNENGSSSSNNNNNNNNSNNEGYYGSFGSSGGRPYRVFKVTDEKDVGKKSELNGEES